MSTSSDLHYLEMYELSRLIRTGRLSPVEVTEAQLARIDQLDGRLHSYARITPELALEQARQAERELARGECRSPLHGIPLAVKDLFHTAGVPTAAGMPIHRDFIPREDATVVARLREAGSVLLGKLQMTEGAFAIHHPDIVAPVNPWGADHWAGASSSGCGVATAAGLCYASLGSDTGGSIRFPCAANGLTGLKPTWGRVSRHGTFELAASLDHVGPITRSARDALFLLSTIAGHDPRDPTSLPSVCLEVPGIDDSFRGLRVGIDEAWLSDGVDPVIQEALQLVMAIIRDGGGSLLRVRMPDTRAVSGNWERHCGVQTAVAHAETYPRRAAEYGPALSRLIDGGREMSGMDYQRILLDAQRFSGELDCVLNEVDLLLAPVQPYAAPTHAQLANLAQDPEANRRLIQFTAPFNVSGHPCLSLPCGFTGDGLPLGCQFIAGKGAEALLCRAGMALQKVSTWHRVHPPGL
ncbi:amidase [Zestomonas carbonaria]|uniref:Amidase AmiD n=1 Tax=Zestomonas carbonaria TaxID=2762745 RepID=A0A7U7EJF8_9GAMM|nr:amidase [Pseudomonas carbonaria]CAD5106158.1 Putative amidase AmiD [Pseudomonas carbonaria]